MNRKLTIIFLGALLHASLLPAQQTAKQPNILWVSCEDLSPWLSYYGDSTVATPNLDRLARKGIIYDHVYTTAGVCAPSRCAIITGVNQVTAGGHNMRTLGNTYPEQTGLPESYSIVPPAGIHAFPEYLRARGYYCTNNSKTDYQFEAPPTVWDECSTTASWRNRKPGQPFFAVVNFTVTHESQVWKRKNHPMHVDPAWIKLPPYYPDTKQVRTDVARFYSNIVDLDSLVGLLLQDLKEDGLQDSTIIFFWGDHGNGLPFYKREVYDRGLHIPLTVTFPDGYRAGEREERLVSSIDLGPTVLSLAGIRTPAAMQGVAFLGKYTGTPHQYVFGARDRMDSEYDRVRSVKDKRYQYVRNFFTDRPLYQDIAYRLQQDMMPTILSMAMAHKLDSFQMRWFSQKRVPEELYDLQSDPWELHNLADDPRYQDQLVRLRAVMDQWLTEVHDLGAVPEKQLLKQMWQGMDHPPATENVVVQKKGRMLVLHCATEDASVGYKLWDAGSAEPTRWEVYTHPINFKKGQHLKTVAQRIGYQKTIEQEEVL